MALNFKSSPAERIFTQDSFAGVDFTSETSKVSANRSPDSKNMLINKSGYVEKRTGYKRVYEGEGNINGIFEYMCGANATTYRFIHIGTSLYKFSFDASGNIVLGDLMLTGLGDKKSRGFAFGGAFYIIGAGYIKIGYDDFTKSLCYGFVKNASTLSDAPTVISDRTPSAFDGTSHDYKCDSAYKKISYVWELYSFHNHDKLYVAPLEFADKVRVDSVYFAGTGEHFRVGEQNYEVKSDRTGMYVELQRNTLDVDRTYTCSPYVILQYDSFAYAPTVVTGRLPIGQSEIGGSVRGADGNVTTEFTPYTGEVLEGANLAAKLRKIDFYYKASDYPSLAEALRLYTGSVTPALRIWIDGSLVHKFRDTGNTELVRYTDMGFVELKRSLLSTENVITVEYAVSGDCDVIDDCSIYAMYGGSNDTRVFVSGNEKYRSRDFASGLFDGSYFSDLQYTDVGSEESAIVGYHKLYGNLIVVKDGVGNDSAQYLRSFTLTTDVNGTTTAVFAVKQGNISYGAANTSSFKSIGGVPLYLGHDGVFVISGTSVENQNNTACVSQMINGRLKGEGDFADAVCAQLGGRYYMFFGNHAYVYDTENGFEWFYFDHLPNARCVWVRDNTMYFGTDGNVYRFMAEDESMAYYDDVALDGSVENAAAIEAVWELPATTLNEYANYKTVRNCYVTCMPHTKSSVKVYYNTNEDYRDWVLGENIDLFSFDNVDFGRFTFRSIEAPFVFATGVKVKNVYVFGLRLVNDVAGEPFGFLAVSVKYRLGKYVK